jgi:hypothetical protein
MKRSGGMLVEKCPGIDETGGIIVAYNTRRPESVGDGEDNKGTRFGDNTAILELLESDLPGGSPEAAYSSPTGQLASVYGFMNGRLNNENAASLIKRTIYQVAAFLDCVVHIQ